MDESRRCRFCAALLKRTFVDLGISPLCESYMTRDGLNQIEPIYPLHTFVWETCLLVQREQFIAPEHISDPC